MLSDWVLFVDRGLEASGGYVLVGDHAEVVCDGDPEPMQYVEQKVSGLSIVDCYQLLLVAKNLHCTRIIPVTTPYTFKIGWEEVTYRFTWGGEMQETLDKGVQALPWMYDHLCRVAARKSLVSSGTYVWDPTRTYCFDSNWRAYL